MEGAIHCCPLNPDIPKTQISERGIKRSDCYEGSNDSNKIADKSESSEENNESPVQTDVAPQHVEDASLKHDICNEREYSNKMEINELNGEVEVAQRPDQTETSKEFETFIYPSLVFENVKMLTGAWTEFYPKKGQIYEQPVFLKGCKWSPDGTCLLTNSEDSTMRLFDLPLQLYNCHCLPQLDFPELRPSLRVKIGGLVYDYCWYPMMTSMNPETCCFLTTSSNSPVQLWDAFTGSLRCSYRGYNVQDELHAALSLTFHPSGDLVLCGYKNSVNIFHTDVPGRDCTVLSTKGLCEQKGLVSCMAVNPSMPNIFAAGTYSKSVGLYSLDGHGMCLLEGQSGGLTQLIFSADGSRLFTAGRKDSDILCWDLRQLGQVLSVMQRPHTTNQRVYMDLSTDNRFLFSGSTDGQVYVWDLQSTTEDSVLQPSTRWRAHNDCVNGVSVHRHIPVIATASGQRYVSDIQEGDNDDSVFATERPKDKFEESVKIWWTGSVKRFEESVEETRFAKAEENKTNQNELNT